MASRVAEVLYKLRDLFTQPAKKIEAGYARLRGTSRKSADAIAKDNRKLSRSFLSLDPSKTGINKLTNSFRSLRGALALGGAVAGLRGLVNSIDRVGKASAKLGVTTEAFSKLSFAAEKSGVSSQQFEVAIQRLLRKTGDAVSGLGEAQKAFATFGINAEEFAKLNLEDKIADLSVAFQSIGDREQALAALQKLVDSEGVGLAVLLEQGPGGIAELTDELERLGGVVRQDLADDAARFADALTSLENAGKGAAFTVGGPVIEALNLWAGALGLNANEIDNLKAKLEIATAQFNLAEQTLGDTSRVTRAYAGEISRLTVQLRALEAQSETSRAATQKETQARQEQLQINKAYADDLESLTQVYEKSADAKRAVIDKETKELEKARKAQLDIEKEFKGLVQEITAPPPGEVFLVDVFNQINQARAALERGETDQAVTLARQGGDLLGALKDKGTETQGTLSFLAKQLQTVAKTAADTKVDAEIVDVDQAKAAFATIQQQADILTATAPAAGSAYAQAFLEAMRAELTATTLPAPQIAPVARGAVSLPISDNTSGQSVLNSLVDKQGAK